MTARTSPGRGLVLWAHGLLAVSTDMPVVSSTPRAVCSIPGWLRGPEGFVSTTCLHGCLMGVGLRASLVKAVHMTLGFDCWAVCMGQICFWGRVVWEDKLCPAAAQGCCLSAVLYRVMKGLEWAVWLGLAYRASRCGAQAIIYQMGEECRKQEQVFCCSQGFTSLSLS